MNGQSQMFAYIMSIIVIVLFVVAFLLLAWICFAAKRRLYKEGNEDLNLGQEVQGDLKKLGVVEDKDALLAKLSKKRKNAHVMTIMSNAVFFSLLAVVVAASVFVGVTKNEDSLTYIGDSASLVIETGSMASVNAKNNYLNENGLLNESDRIHQYSFITINHVEEKDMKVYNVYAFRLKGQSEGSYVTIVHRLVNIQTQDDGHKTYTFRGDANSGSMVGEMSMEFSEVLGVWTGYQNLPLGQFIYYLRSPLGLIIILVACAFLVIYEFFYSRYLNEYKLRYDEVLARHLFPDEADPRKTLDLALKIKKIRHDILTPASELTGPTTQIVTQNDQGQAIKTIIVDNDTGAQHVVDVAPVINNENGKAEVIVDEPSIKENEDASQKSEEPSSIDKASEEGDTSL